MSPHAHGQPPAPRHPAARRRWFLHECREALTAEWGAAEVLPDQVEAILGYLGRALPAALFRLDGFHLFDELAWSAAYGVLYGTPPDRWDVFEEGPMLRSLMAHRLPWTEDELEWE